jgi:hypothetical protein
MANWDWDSTARRGFRVASLVLGIVLIGASVVRLLDLVGRRDVTFDSSITAAIAWFVWGLLFLVIAIRGALFKRKMPSKE